MLDKLLRAAKSCVRVTLRLKYYPADLVYKPRFVCDPELPHIHSLRTLGIVNVSFSVWYNSYVLICNLLISRGVYIPCPHPSPKASQSRVRPVNAETKIYSTRCTQGVSHGGKPPASSVDADEG